MSQWRDEIKKLGRREFERREMERLGFWPPVTLDREQTEAGLHRINEGLRDIAGQSRPLRLRAGEIESQIAAVGDIEKQISEIRRQRIERVKAARQERRERRAREKVEREAREKAWRAAQLPHLGRGVSARLDFTRPSDEEKLSRHALPTMHSPHDVAGFLEISIGQLAWLCYHREAAPLDHYSHFTILKRSGGLRAISAPRPHLKAAQTRILRALLDLVPVHQSAAAFRPALHIGHNATQHTHLEKGGPEVVLRVDLKDFFPSITFARVAGVFASLGYNGGVATLLALICTESPRVEVTLDGQKSFVALGSRFVPQGAPTSPALTNLLCRRLDARLSGMAAHYGFIYTRYADDLVFSSGSNDANALGLKSGVLHVLESENLEVNPDKVAISRRGQRQSVTGLVVGNGLGPRPSRRDLRRFRAVLHHIETRGAEATSQEMGQSAVPYARGYCAFLQMVAPDIAAKLRSQHGFLADETE